MDVNNPVIKLCAEGMQAEAVGDNNKARERFTQAWEISTDDYEACIAAHYLARHQETAQDTFKWNRESLDRAEAIAGDERIREFYPSLYLNLGYSCETLGDRAEARRFYEMAAAKLADVPDGDYKNIVLNGVEGGFKRTEAAE